MTFMINNINVHPDDYEQLGTKEKFWFIDEHENKHLFKYSRENTGEHWSEKAAEELCKALDIPHVKYEMATMFGRIGVVSPNIVPKGCRMIMGNEVLHSDSTIYPSPTTQQLVRVKEHTVRRVLGCLDKSDILPPQWLSVSNLNAGDVFCGYLMLDALISNQDRHHENWAIIIDIGTQKKYLCETYDHAACLGRELKDDNRANRLKTKDKNLTIAGFVSRARSELFKLKTDKKPMLTIDAFFIAIDNRSEAKKHWINKLQSLTDDKIRSIFNEIPSCVISDVAREFALQMVLENKRRLLKHDKT